MNCSISPQPEQAADPDFEIVDAPLMVGLRFQTALEITWKTDELLDRALDAFAHNKPCAPAIITRLRKLNCAQMSLLGDSIYKTETARQLLHARRLPDHFEGVH